MSEIIGSILSLAFLTIIIYYIWNEISKYKYKSKLEKYKRNRLIYEEKKKERKIKLNETKVKQNEKNIEKDKVEVGKIKVKVKESKQAGKGQFGYSHSHTEDPFHKKGADGEYMLVKELEKISCYKKIYTNTYIPRWNKTTTEIDVIMVTGYGIYVFESKNFNGYIFGNELDNNWTQVFNKKSKFKFYNPILQNKGHILALNDYLKIYVPNIYRSYIVFGQESVLSDITFNSSNTEVIKVDKLKETIENDFRHSDKWVLTEKQIDLIDLHLKKLPKVDELTKENHIENIKGFINNKNK